MPGPRKRFRDIELALRWAYGDELPKRQTGGRFAPKDMPSSLPMFRQAVSGETRQWSGEPGFPAAAGDCHPDAIAIEAAVKGLSTWAGHGFGPDRAAAGLMHGIDHMDIDYLQAGLEAVAAMAGIVAVHARAGTRPRWSRELPRPFPDNGGNGKPRVLIDETFAERVDRKGVYYELTRDPSPGAITFVQAMPSPPIRGGLYRQGSYCPIVFRPNPARLVAERAEYLSWRMGLEILCRELEGQLAATAVLTPAAPWRPWAGEGEAHGVSPDLFRGQRDEPHRRETREQAAAQRRAVQRRRLRDHDEEARPATGGRRGCREGGNGTNGP